MLLVRWPLALPVFMGAVAESTVAELAPEIFRRAGLADATMIMNGCGHHQDFCRFTRAAGLVKRENAS